MGWTWEVREEGREQALSLELSWSGAGCWGCVGGFQMGLQKGAWIAWEQRLLSPGPPPEGDPIPAEAWDILTRRSSQGPVYLLGSVYLASPGTPGETWSMRWGAPGPSHSKALGSRKAGSQNPAESQGHTLSEQAD